MSHSSHHHGATSRVARRRETAAEKRRRRRVVLALAVVLVPVVVVVLLGAGALWPASSTGGVDVPDGALVAAGTTFVTATVRFMIPALLSGENPFAVGLVSCAAIMFVLLYLAHGVSIRTTTALIGTLFGLGASTVYTIVFAYAGAALPILLLINVSGLPIGTILTTGMGDRSAALGSDQAVEVSG